MPARRHLLLPVATVLFGLTACTPASAPVAAPASAPATTAPEATAAPKTTTPPTATTAPKATKTSDRTAASPGCPSAKDLERLVDLPKDWYFVPSSVECWKGWATARPDGPNHGDGDYLFRYQRSAGWKYHSQGSAYDCADLGIKEEGPICGHN